jgi:hypothetical protein
MTTTHTKNESLPELLARALPFLRDEAAKYTDDGNNEPLELARSIEAELADRRNRDAREPGGVQCEKCGSVFIGAEWHVLCGMCIDHGVAQPDGSGLRDGDNMPASMPATSPLPQVANPADTALTREAPTEGVPAPGAIRALVTAANAVLAANPADDGMWTLELAVRPFNATKPVECANGCPDKQVCDYCQAATPPAPQRMAQGEDAVQRANIKTLANEWRHVLTDGRDGHELCANRNTVACFVNAIDALTTQPPHHDRGEASKFMHDMLIDWRAAASIGRPLTGDEIWEFERRMIDALTEAKQQGPGEAVLTTAERSVIDTLLGLAFAAWRLADNSEDGGSGITVDRKDFGLLSRYLDALDTLPDDQPGYTMAEAAKARWALRRLLTTAPQVEAKRQTGEGG